VSRSDRFANPSLRDTRGGDEDAHATGCTARPWHSYGAVSAAIKGTAAPVLYVFGGFALGWVSTTVPRYAYPPPAKCDSVELGVTSDLARRWRRAA